MIFHGERILSSKEEARARVSIERRMFVVTKQKFCISIHKYKHYAKKEKNIKSTKSEYREFTLYEIQDCSSTRHRHFVFSTGNHVCIFTYIALHQFVYRLYIDTEYDKNVRNEFYTVHIGVKIFIRRIH